MGVVGGCEGVVQGKKPGKSHRGSNTCIVTNSYGIVKVIDVFNEYGRASGARLNHSKSKGLWLGRWRLRSDSPCGPSWLRSSLKIVGLSFKDSWCAFW